MQKIVDAPTFFKKMSSDEFLKLGIRDIAYIKPVQTGEDQASYSIHAADGTTLSVKKSMDMALSAIMQSDLAPITIH